MNKTITIKCIYSYGTKHTSENWKQVCADHEDEFPFIHKCFRGTFNVSMTGSIKYLPPGDSEYRTRAKKRGESVKRYEHGNHIAPCAKVVKINDEKIEAWIYRGGTPGPNILELISAQEIAKDIKIKDRDELTILIMEVEENTNGMPKPPPNVPGKTVENSGWIEDRVMGSGLSV